VSRRALAELGLWLALVALAVLFALCVVPGHGRLLPQPAPRKTLECTEWNHYYGSRVGIEREYITYTVCDRYEWRVGE
jgi:hypothetical protein